MKNVLPLLIFLFVFIGIVNGQDDKSPTVKFLNKRGYIFPDSNKIVHTRANKKWPDTLYYNTRYKATLLGSPTIPFSFTNIENTSGQYEVSPTISLGYGYTWFFGDFIFNEDDKITVDPTFFFGLIADAALQSYINLNNITGIFTGGFIGFGNISIFAGYDWINHSPNIGLGGRIDVYTITQNALKPWGKVKEVRKHKKIAIPIANE